MTTTDGERNGTEGRFKLAIIGGCLANQPGIAYSALYHRVLANLLRKHDGIKLQVVLAHHFNTDYSQRLQKTLERGPVDMVLLHMRIEELQDRVKFYLRYYNQAGQLRLMLNPYLKNRPVNNWLQIKSSLKRLRHRVNRATTARTFEKKPRFRWFDLNVLLGVGFGVINRLAAAEVGAILRLAKDCTEQKLPLLVLGPTTFRQGWLRGLVYQELTRKILTALTQAGIESCLLPGERAANGASYLKPDRYHLSAAGHRAIAELLYNHLILY